MTDTADHIDPRHTSAEEASRLMTAATKAAVLTAAILAAIKALAWWMTGSVALLGSLLDSLLDMAASIGNFVAVRHALSPRDHEHRFGHGKAEALAGLGQAVLITLSALFLISESYQQFVTPQPLTNSNIGIGVTVIAIVMTLLLVRFQSRVIAKSGSLAIAADELHYKGDLFMNAAVIVALVLSGIVNIPWVDPLIGMCIAGYILYAVWQIVQQSYDQLMDAEFPDEKRKKVLDIARSHPEVMDVHDLRTRSAGTWDFIQCHIELDPQISLIKAHDIADEVEALLKQAFPRAEIILHQDPAGLEELTPLEQD